MTTLKIHNTPTGKIEEFKPINGNVVKIYTCGPTVYDYAHVGNLSAYIFWDVLIRLLTADGYSVERVLNITDVGHLVSDGDTGEDKLEKGAKRDGKSAWEIAKFYTNYFIQSMDKLNLIRPEHIAKATDYIDQQIDLVRVLKNKGVTYQISDGIYFDTSKFPQYANFAHLNIDELKEGARVEINPEKHNPTDFALWKFSNPNEKRDMEWETPFDILEDSKLPDSNSQIPIAKMGFPGWHLECSAIALNILGETIDIHTGGIDHIPVHHTNEIAQSETATGQKFSNYWLHNNFMTVDGTKISKSLGNGYTLEDLEDRGFSAIDFRMLVLQSHYRSQVNFTFDNLEAAKNRLNNWRSIACLRHQVHDTIISDEERNQNFDTVPNYATSMAIIEALNNDLGTPEALKIIDESFSIIQNANFNEINHDALNQLINNVDELLGLKLAESTPDISDEAKQIIIARKNARIDKNWEKSDELRDKLNKIGIAIRDTNHDTIWNYIN